MNKTSWFSRASKAVSSFTGTPLCFGLAAGVLVVWGLTGPVFQYSDSWQLVMNTGAGLITFLMVFLIQNAQNRHTDAIQVKPDELIRATQGAHNSLLDLEDLEPGDIEAFRQTYNDLAKKAREARRATGVKDGSPDIGIDALAHAQDSAENAEGNKSVHADSRLNGHPQV
jgi:low affinity Fe/Cu permease